MGMFPFIGSHCRSMRVAGDPGINSKNLCKGARGASRGQGEDDDNEEQEEEEEE
jgi:hypothetical protein